MDPLQSSPLALSASDAKFLVSNPGFRLFRAHLSSTSPSFCSSHSFTSSSVKETWLLHRDITYALILPVLRIYNQASQLAQDILDTTSCSTDLELAFVGEGRGAFSWLQCFIKGDSEWFRMGSCPACTTLHILQSEPTVRFTLTAISISSYLSFPLASRTMSSLDEGESTAEHVPSLGFLLPSLSRALSSDPQIFPPAFVPAIYARARTLEAGIQDLLLQCCQLSSFIPSPSDDSASSMTSTSSVPGQAPARPIKRCTYSNLFSAEQGKTSNGAMKVKPSRLARRQMRLCMEERLCAKRILLAMEEWRNGHAKAFGNQCAWSDGAGIRRHIKAKTTFTT